MAITKYLFLDIDGVLNHKDWYKNINKYDYKRREFDPECVNRVIKILEKTNAKLVIISSRRLDVNLKNIFREVGLPEDFDITPYFHNKTRGYEIVEYLRDLTDYKYCIIDDYNDFSKCQQKYYVPTADDGEIYINNKGSGLTDIVMDKVMEILEEN